VALFQRKHALHMRYKGQSVSDI